MKTHEGFSKRDVIVSICCGVFLLLCLGAIGSSGRRRAKEAVCLSNLKQWGEILLGYAAENDYRLRFGDLSSDPGWYRGLWLTMPLGLERRDPLRFCPEATIPDRAGIEGYVRGQPHTAWTRPAIGSSYEPLESCYGGSYGFNLWFCDLTDYSYPRHPDNYYWGTTIQDGAANIPLLAGSWWTGGFPKHTDDPLPYEGYGFESRREMGYFTINRHRGGHINVLFLDSSVRKTGLKQPWKLKWHRAYDTEYPPPSWPKWMQDFED